MSSIDTASNPFNYKGGDVKIKVKYKGEEMEGMVATQIMLLASPVWNKFLFPPWSTESSKIKEIDFSEDDGEAMLILLNIAHLQLRRAPKELDSTVLYRIAILCEQYDCHNLVEPWLEGWTKDEDKGIAEMGEEEWIYIDWAFGRDESFKKRATHLVQWLAFLPNGAPSVLLSRNFPTTLPDKLLENVMTIREAFIQKMLDLLYQEVYKYMYGKKTVCKHDMDQELCDAASYGGYVLALGRNGLWPLISAKDYKRSASQLIATILGLKVAPYEGTVDRSQRQNHSMCGPMALFKRRSSWLLMDTSDVVLECHIRHMKMRSGTAETSGGQSFRCVRCNTSHVSTAKCPSNPRKTTSEVDDVVEGSSDIQ